MTHDNDNELPRTRAEAIKIKSTHFFTGKSCKRGHTAKRFTSTGGCETCINARTKMWRVDHRDRALESNQASSKKWREENPERWRASYRNAGRKYRQNNADMVNAYREKWNDRNPGAAATRVRNRRARLRNAEGSHSQADIAELLATQKWKCAECSKSVRRSYHVDHITPISRGGTNYKSNLQILCPDCNRRKAAIDPIEFAKSKGRLV